MAAGNNNTTNVKKTSAGKAPVKKKKKRFSAGKALMFAFVAAVLAMVCALGVYIFIIINGNKILNENKDKLEMDEASHMYDASGAEVAVMSRENREIVKKEEIPVKLQNAFIATEDRRFNQHSGIDFLGVGRALVKDIVARSAVEGGSTITQQLAKNLFLSSNKTFFRKATEMSIAVALEDNNTKEDILALYLNRIYFGNRAYGIKAASRKYFNITDLSKLEVWQMATLAAIPKAPSTYNPISNPEQSLARRGVVLTLMKDQGYITEEERVKAADVEYVPPKNTGSGTDYLTFIDTVLNEANDVYKLSEDELLRNGYKIYTTMDAPTQKIMEKTFANEKFFQKDGPEQKMQGAMAIINHKDGSLVGIIGGRDYVARGLNRATLPQQPGSSIKPLLIYAPAIESGKYTPYSMLEDNEANYNGYAPRNYDGVYRGQVDMFEAVRKSINAPAVWLLNAITVKTGMDFASKLGIPFDPVKDRNLAIALGGMTKGATPVQMASAYGAIANNGYLNTTHSIVKILDDKGSEVAAFKQERVAPAMSAKTAWNMTLLMQTVVEPGGTGTAAKFERPVAGKTGSTQTVTKGLEKYSRDLWFTGYTPEWSAAVWIGFDKPDAKHYVTISSGSAAAIFKEVMQKALAKRPMTKFTKPDGVPDLVKPEPVEPIKEIGELKAEYVKESRVVKLSWGSAGDKATYELFRKGDKDKDFPAEPLLPTSSTEVNDPTVKQGETYQYVVMPVNSDTGKPGTKSGIVTISVPAEDSAAPGTGAPGQLPGQQGGTKPGTGTTPGNGGGTTPPKTGTTPGAGTTPGTGANPGTGTVPGTGTSPGTGSTPGTGTAPGTGNTPGTGTGATPGTGTTPGTGAQPGTGANSGTGTQPGSGTGTTPSGGAGATSPAPQNANPAGSTPSNGAGTGTGAVNGTR